VIRWQKLTLPFGLCGLGNPVRNYRSLFGVVRLVVVSFGVSVTIPSLSGITGRLIPRQSFSKKGGQCFSMPWLLGKLSLMRASWLGITIKTTGAGDR